MENSKLFKSDPAAWVRWRKTKYARQTVDEYRRATEKLQDLVVQYERQKNVQQEDSERRIREIFENWESDMYAARKILLDSGMSEDEVNRIILEKE